jgi:uncharacterized protein (DUF488 family)
LLKTDQIKAAVDVRSYPSSKRHPWFGQEALRASLEDAGIAYDWFKDLGGRRKPGRGPSPHTAIKEPAFRSYADWMESAPFRQAVDRLLELAARKRCTLFCAEKDPMHCHRRFLADFMTIQGVTVVHLIEPGNSREHTVHPDLVVEDGKLIYRGRQGRLF